jgi:hypothetical protein
MENKNKLVYYTLVKSFFFRDQLMKLKNFFNTATYKRFKNNPHSSISTWVMLCKFFSDDVLTKESVFDFSFALDNVHKKLSEEYNVTDFEEVFNIHDFRNLSLRNLFLPIFSDIQIDDDLYSNREDYSKLLDRTEMNKLLHLIWAPITFLEEGLNDLNKFEKVLIFAEVGLPNPKKDDNNNLPEMEYIIREARSRIIDYRGNVERLVSLFNQIRIIEQNESIQ